MVRTPEGSIIVDFSGKVNGRGAYLCKQPECYQKGLKKERLAQALKVSVSPQEMATLQVTLQSELSKV